MKNTITQFLFLILIAIGSNSKAQIGEHVIAEAYYQLNHRTDSGNFETLTTEKYVLQLGKSSSYYFSSDRKIQDSLRLSEYRKTKSLGPPSGNKGDNTHIYIYNGSHKMFIRDRVLLADYVVERSYPKIAWKVKAERRMVNGYNCQKAEGEYHGRTYEVWFTPDLPFTAGPWKLCGLPGLIVSAIDHTKRINFELINFKKIRPNSTKTTSISKNAKSITWKDYTRLAEMRKNDFVAYVKNQFGGTIQTSGTFKHKDPLLPPSRITFPLEAISYYKQY